MYQINMLQYFTSYASFRCFCGVDGVADGKKQRGGAVSNTGFLGTRSDAVSFFLAYVSQWIPITGSHSIRKLFVAYSTYLREMWCIRGCVSTRWKLSSNGL